MSSISRPGICTNLLTSAKLQFSTSSLCLKSHYDTLGITPKATQSDIKTAYYKLTKIYHPDKNKSEEAKVKFRDVTDAYEILGNYKSRRLYDRGMRGGPRHVDSRTPEEKKKDDAQTRFYKSRLTRTQVQTANGRTPIYNFDEWAKTHYGELFDQTRRARATMGHRAEIREEKMIQQDNKLVLYPIIMVFFMLVVTLSTTRMNEDYDRNKLISDKKKES